MKKIELTQGQVALVDDIDYEYLSQWKWCASWIGKNFRPMRFPWIDGKQKTLYMYTVIANRMGIDSKLIDHIDRNSLNNQRSNLRSATHSQNQHNRGAPLNSKTGVKGVSFYKPNGKYQANITIDRKQYHLGLFDTISEAEKIVIAKRKELVGEFAHD